MLVAAVTLDYPPRRFIGSELATHAMLKALQQAGHDVEVFTLARDALPFTYDGIPVTPGVRWLRRIRPDVIVSHVELAAKVRRWKVPSVGVTHNARSGAQATVGDPAWSLIVHNAQTTADQLAEWRQAPYIVVHPPVDWRDYQVDRDGAEAYTLVNVTGEKGSDTFYELAKRMPDRRFLGVLGGYQEQERKDLPNVELVPHTGDMRAVYAQTRVLLMPSEHESWGRVAVEAMSSGIPVVATDLPGIRECVADAGVLVEPYWFDEWERQLRLLDDPDTYEALSKRASARAKKLDPRKQLAAFVAAVEDLGR